MNTVDSIDSKITTIIDAGTASLNKHNFASEKLNDIKRMSPIQNRRANAFASEESQDEEKNVNFRLNATGNIYYSTSSPDLNLETKELFQSVTVLFSAMTKALEGKKKSIYDYEAWSSVIAKSGFFVEVQKYQKTLTIESSSLTIDTQIVQQLIPGLTSGNSMEIAKGILSSINGEFKKETVNESAKLSHLLFICEELFGSPSVTVRLFFATKSSHTSITSSPCHKTSSAKIEQFQEANTFLFVSPESIAKYASKFKEFPNEYETLIAKLSSYIDEAH